jgi:hypothetical protein
MEINLEKIMGDCQEQRIVIPPCISQVPLNFETPLHEMPQKYDKVLRKLHLDRLSSLEDHIKKLLLSNQSTKFPT